MNIFAEILISNNSSIAILPYSYILCMDGIMLDRISFMDFELTYGMYNVWGVYQDHLGQVACQVNCDQVIHLFTVMC